MQTNKESKEINALTDIMDWVSENQKICYRVFRPDYNDDLRYEDLIEAIADLTEKRYYVLLFVLIAQNRYNCHLDEILERAIYKFCAKKIQENDIQEFSQFVIDNLNVYTLEKEEDEKSNDMKGMKYMDEKLVQIFETYKSSKYYNNCMVEMNLDWLKEKLDVDDLEGLEKQIYDIVLENEEELFINCFKYAFGLFQEISTKKN